MSYAFLGRRGLGQITTPQAVQEILAKIPSTSPAYKFIDAVNTIASDAETVTNMTSAALSLLTSINAITNDVVTGTAITVAADTSALAADIGGEIADGVGDVLSIVPVAGAIIGAIIKIAAGVAGASAAGDLAQEQMVAAGANGFMKTAVPVGVDSSEITPADFFAPIYVPDPTFDTQGMPYIYFRPQRIASQYANVPRKIAPCPAGLPEMYCYPGGYEIYTGGPAKGQAHPSQEATGLAYNVTGGMPAIGWALARATEGYGLAPVDLAWLTNTYHAINPNWGVPAARSVMYRKLRQAIQAQLGVVGSNEGQDLWPIYLDMLRQDFDAGHLSRDWITVLLTPPFNPIRVGGVLTLADPDDYANFGIANLGPLSDQIVSMVNQWKITNNPVTMQDIQHFVDVVASVTPSMNAAAFKASITPVNAAAKLSSLKATLANDIKVATTQAIAKLQAQAAPLPKPQTVSYVFTKKAPNRVTLPTPIVKKITPIEGVLIGATLIGAGVVGMKIAKKKGWIRSGWPRRRA